MTRRLDRRKMLRGVAVSPIAGAAVAAEPDPAHAHFCRWMELNYELYAASAPLPPGWEDANGDAMAEAWHSMQTVPSLVSAAAQIMTVIFTDCCPEDTPAGLLGTRGENEITFALRLLICLRPHLSGPILEYVSDVLDHPHRTVGESQLARATAGRT